MASVDHGGGATNRHVEMQRARRESRDRIGAHVERRVLPLLGGRPPATLDVPELGGKSLVYVVRARGVPPFVLRADRVLRTIARRVANHEALLGLGFDVPAVLHHALDPITRLRAGFYFMAEKRLDGVSFAEAADLAAHVPRLGRVFARLHGHRSFGRGCPWPRRRRLLRQRLSLRHKAGQWIARYVESGGADLDRVRAWVRRWPRATWRFTPRLCLGDVIPTNVLVCGDAVRFVDLSSVRLSSMPFELARIRTKLLGDDDGRWETFRSAYLDGADADHRAEVERSLPLLEGLQRIRLAGSTEAGEAREHHRERLLAILDRDV